MRAQFVNEFLKSEVKLGNEMTVYHSSLKRILSVSSAPIHVGTYEQAIDRAYDIESTENIPNDQIYLHKIQIKITNPYPRILKNIDENRDFQKLSDFTKHGPYNEFMYVNMGEGTDANFFQKGAFDIKNLSLFIVDFEKSYISSQRYKFKPRI